MKIICRRNEGYKMNNQLITFLKDERGATAIEYGLIAGSIAAVIIGTVNLLGSTLVANYYAPILAAF